MAAKTFAIDVKRWADKTKLNLDIVQRKILLDISVSLVSKSPVGNPTIWKVNIGRPKRKLVKPPGYVGGHFKANWFYGMDTVPADTIWAVDPRGGETISRLQNSIPKEKLGGHVHYFVNNLPYAMRLEHGWSTTAPSGMVKLTAVEFSKFYNDALRSL